MEEERIKQKYDFFISYANNDSMIAREIKELLTQFGYCSWLPIFDIKIGEDFQSSINNAIRKAKAVILIITDSYLKSQHCRTELFQAISGAKDTGRLIIPFCHENCEKAIDEYFLAGYNYVLFNEKNIHSKVPALFEIYENRYKSDALYERLNQFIEIGNSNYIIKTISELLPLLPKTISYNEEINNLGAYYELFLLLNVMDKNISPSSLEKESAIYLEHILTYLDNLFVINDDDLYLQDIKLLNLALIINVVKAKENIGLTLFGKSDLKSKTYRYEATKIAPIFKSYISNYVLENYNEREQEIIECAKEYIESVARKPKKPLIHLLQDKDKIEGDNSKRNTKVDVTFHEVDTDSTSVDGREKTIEEKLFDIAKYIEQSNELFEKVGDKNETYQFLKCLKTSYERLKNFCEVIKCGKVMAYCIERISEVDSKLNRLLDSEKEKEELKESSFKALLGFSLASDKNFDVFLSYRHRDEDIATNVYSFLKKNLVKVFMDKMSLPEMGESEYRRATDRAIRYSDHFLLLVTDINDLNEEDGWMWHEYNLYLDLKAEKRKKGGNLVMIFEDSLYDKEVTENRKDNLPDSLCCSFQIFKMSEYKDKILKYFKKNN